MGWTVEIGNQGASLSEYPFLDFDFIKRLNAVGWGYANLAGLDGNPEPAADDVIRFIYSKGATEYVHFEGILLHNERLGTDPTRKVTFMDVAGAQLWRARTGTARHYEDLTPHQIIQGGGSPSDLLTNAQGTGVITYGTSASVPNKIDATNPGVQLDDFLADSTRLLVNVQRLCLQSRYGTAATPDGSYGLEFFGQLEGANNSNPRFYLVKRQLQSPAPGETFDVGDEFFKARRGEKGLTANDAVRVVGGGHGQSRIQSAVIGSGGLEGIVQDKAILSTTNATNMATRLQGLLDPANEAVTANSYKHDYDTRVGDDLTLTQTGFSNKTLRVFEIGYSLRAKQWIWQLGRPRPMDKDPFYMLEGVQGGHGTTGQKRSFEFVGNAVGSPAAIASGASSVATVNFTTTYLAALHDGIAGSWQFTTDAAGAYDLLIEVGDASGFKAVIGKGVGLDSTLSAFDKFFLSEASLEISPPPTDDFTRLRVTVTNRTGGPANVSLSATASILGG